ncbi:2,3-bisphosphoglycerate-independent phosphoglycerate mutase, partial [Candidatus Woesearchaeota archaeon]|nr:2,3-bisphosphoglycerate-independent phosphoglycerate mutase [Candidatus Woesearchaeota archaeon]
MKPLILLIMDGWGLKQTKKGNAIKAAKTPNYNKLWKKYPHTILQAAGQAVGLPPGYMGGSEVGHTHFGSGRLIPQELMEINNSIKNKSFFKNKVLLNSIKHKKKHDSALHFLGLLSDAGVHSHINHLFALLKMAKMNGVKDRIYIHAILDGRDTHPKSSMKYINMVKREIKKLKIDAKISTIMGRYYGMDRDNRWRREHKAYDAMVNKEGRYMHYKNLKDIKDYINGYYKKGITDEFIPPTVTEHGTVEEKDAIVFFNFRSDRARELTKAFVQGKFKGFKRKKIIDLNFVCLTQYSKEIKAPVAFPQTIPKQTLGEIISKKRIKQLRIAETEKYAHVTYFFNGGKEGPFPKEDRILIPSPKVSTYDKTPSMSAPKILRKVVEQIKKNKYPLIILNFANCDMVGHTGNWKATVKAIQTVDKFVGVISDLMLKKDGYCLITADHG